MSDGSSRPSDDDRQLFDIDTSVARPARVYDYLVGGDGNFAADREAAEYMSAVLPGGLDSARATVRALGDFMERAVRYLITEAGGRQFLYIGAPIPTNNEVHEAAQRLAPDARVVYVGSDPVVLAHAHRRRRSTAAGAIGYVHGTLGDPKVLVREAGTTLDLGRPVAIMLPATLSFVPDGEDPAGIVARLLEAVPSGSHLVVAHATSDIPSEGMVEAAERLSEMLHETYAVRSRAEIARFFDGLDMVDPGLVQIARWRPREDGPVIGVERDMPMLVGLGRKT